MTKEERQQVEREVREECARIAALEGEYWGRVENERIQELSIGAMGAAANICAAILMGHTAEQHKNSKTSNP